MLYVCSTSFDLPCNSWPIKRCQVFILMFPFEFCWNYSENGEEKSNLTDVEDMSLLTGSDVMGYLVFPPLIRNWKIKLFRVHIDPLIWKYFSEVLYILVNLQGLMMDHVEISQPVNITLLSPNISNLERHKNWSC